jgi:23S rRNA (adenine2503-C2)-methyltransferase
LGLKRNLISAEILNQVLAVRGDIEEPEKLRNMVFMGMGEPLANYRELKKALDWLLAPQGFNFSPRHVTVSTVGLVPLIHRLGKEFPVQLAVSLNAAEDEIRSRLMPVNRKYPLNRLISALKQYPLRKNQRITFEYVLLAGVNDRVSDAKKLAGLLKGIPAKINLIPYNPHPGSLFKTPTLETTLAFQKVLVSNHLTAPVRWSKGRDISAACGQLGASSFILDNKAK